MIFRDKEIIERIEELSTKQSLLSSELSSLFERISELNHEFTLEVRLLQQQIKELTPLVPELMNHPK